MMMEDKKNMELREATEHLGYDKEHDGLSFGFSGRCGVHIKTGMPMREFILERRIWVAADGTVIED